MKEKMVPLVVMLSAGLVSCIVSIIRKTAVLRSLLWLLGTLVVFYLLGTVAKYVFDKIKAQREYELEQIAAAEKAAADAAEAEASEEDNQ